MSPEDFIRNCYKINDGENLPEELLRQDYNSISKEEIKCTRDFATTEHLSKCILFYKEFSSCLAEIYTK